MEASAAPVTVIPALRYADADAAVEWLCRAFGFQEHAVYRNDHGKVVHAELRFGNGMIMLGPDVDSEFGRLMMLPKAAGGRCTQANYIVVGDVDAHHAHAAAAGADVIFPPKDEDYGGRGYTCRDPEGHIWAFGSYDPWAQPPATAG